MDVQAETFMIDDHDDSMLRRVYKPETVIYWYVSADVLGDQRACQSEVQGVVDNFLRFADTDISKTGIQDRLFIVPFSDESKLNFLSTNGL